MKQHITLFMVFLLVLSCSTDPELAAHGSSYPYGAVGEDLDAEWEAYVRKYPDLSAGEARARFDAIQNLSKDAFLKLDDAQALAALHDRRALANALIEKEITNTYELSDVSDEMVRAAYNAFAFDTGQPELVTVSHLLLRESKVFDENRAKDYMQRIYDDIVLRSAYNDESLRDYALLLTRAGERSDMNADLSFPRHAMSSFMGMQVSYQNMVEEFAAAAFALNEKTVLSPPVRSEFGYHLILFKERRFAYQPPYDEVKEYIREKILERGRTIATQQLLERLQSEAKIRVNEELLSQIAN
ncbi:MAG: peptidyl-prolyl cis-trans isomerase [Bradymonadales bacterium]|jgi:hypothetical protein